jgi:hypothetical protein
MTYTLVSPYPGNPTETAAAAADTIFSWGAAGTTAIQWLLLSNNSGGALNYALNTSTTTIVDTLADGQKLFLEAVQILSLHLSTASQINLNGDTLPNIAIWGAV